MLPYESAASAFNSSLINAENICRHINENYTSSAPRMGIAIVPVATLGANSICKSAHLLTSVLLTPPAEAGVGMTTMGMLVNGRNKVPTFLEAMFSALVHPSVTSMLCVYFLLILISAHIVWLSERLEKTGNTDEFPLSYVGGIDDAMWWSVVTATSTGYGDKVPKGVVSRVWGSIWMNAGIVVFALLAGQFASMLSESQADPQLYSLADISPDTRVAVMADVAQQATFYLHGRLATKSCLKLWVVGGCFSVLLRATAFSPSLPC